MGSLQVPARVRSQARHVTVLPSSRDRDAALVPPVAPPSSGEPPVALPSSGARHLAAPPK